MSKKHKLTRAERECLATELLAEFVEDFKRSQAKFPPETEEDVANDAEFLAEVTADAERIIRDSLNLR